jgi:ectoine hydroxylase-related dioxygenase (phytanoyl-CoA dioxygenase family)
MVGGPVSGAQSMFYFKPLSARGQALHQDNLLLQASPKTCTAWKAINDIDAENGGLQVVPGSHNYNLVCPESEMANAEKSFTNVGVRLQDGMETSQTVRKAGDVLFFHGSMVHGSGSNYSQERMRRSLIFHIYRRIVLRLRVGLLSNYRIFLQDSIEYSMI